MVRPLTVLLLFAVVLAGVLWASQQRAEPLKVSGFLEADEIRVGSRVGGRVARVLADEGQLVKAGKTLVELEPFDLEQRRAEALAVVAQKRAQLDELQAGYRTEEIEQAKARQAQLAAELDKLRAGPRRQEIAAAAADLELAQAELDLAIQIYERTATLYQMGSATQEALDEASNQRKVAQARVKARTEQLALLEEGTRPEDLRAAEARLAEAQRGVELLVNGYRPEQIAQARATLEAAEAAAAAIERQIAELQIKAPLDARVEAIELQPGDLVAPNAPAITLVDPSRLWVRAYVPVRQLRFKVGDPVEVTVDSYPDEVFQGYIAFVARQAEFTPSNVQTPEERSKQVFRIKVNLEQGLGRLRPGMPADVWLEPRGSRRE